MSEIISKPPTKEYEETWERVFGKKKFIITYRDMASQDEVAISSRLLREGFDPKKDSDRVDDFVNNQIIFTQ